MIAYGKHMLYNDKILDLDRRVKEIDAMTMEDCEKALSMNFDMTKMAAAAVGKIQKPLQIR